MGGRGKDEVDEEAAAAARVSMSTEVVGEGCGLWGSFCLFPPSPTHPFLTPSLPCSSKGLPLALVC